MTDNPFEMAFGNFGSDNLAGVHPRVLEAIARVAGGTAPAYGEDAMTTRVERRFAELFERDCAVFLVATGTASNSLALAALCPPHGAIYCHADAHILVDECSAPEFYTGGARLVGIDGVEGKIDPAGLEPWLERATMRGIHGLKPAGISLTNATEAGTVYRPEEVAAVSRFARRNGLFLHVDGARFANAVAALDVAPAELSWKAGVDVLSFGATKNGAIAAEAIVFFDPAQAGDFAYRRKRAGQLWSKHRFLAAQFDAYLEDGLWLELAAHANAMARRLADGLSALPGASLAYPVEANEVYPVLPEAAIAGLERDGFGFYRWPGREGLIRLVTAFSTRAEEVDAFLESAGRHANRG